MFAAGQVQDAGLIFLSAMATSIVRDMKGESPEDVMATVLCTLAASTALLGFCLILTGKLKLATLVQYLPLPVVGGYLAYIGLFCGQAGLGLMADIEVKHPTDLLQADARQWVLMAPGIILGTGLYVAVSKIPHFSVLPIIMILSIVGFYALLYVQGISLEESREAGWVPSPQSSVEFWKVYDLYQPWKVCT
jgi:SulP family sulfate permease